MLSKYCPMNPEIQQTQFSCLDLTCHEIRIIDKIRPAYSFISQLYLDHNRLITLNGIQQFQNLQVLSFNFNHIQMFGELSKIKNQFFLKQLSFIGNPVENDLKCKFQYLVTHGFPNLTLFNSLGTNRLKLRFINKKYEQIEKQKQKYRQRAKTSIQLSNQGKTFRYSGMKDHQYQQEYEQTRRIFVNKLKNIKSKNRNTIIKKDGEQISDQHEIDYINETNIKSNNNLHYNAKSGNKNRRTDAMNMSTTVNKDTNKEGLASSANKSMSLFTLMKNKISKNRIEQQVVIKPFSEVQQGTGTKTRVKDRKNKKLGMQDNKEWNQDGEIQQNNRNSIQQQSQIKGDDYRDISVSLFSKTGHFDKNTIDYSQQKYRQQSQHQDQPHQRNTNKTRLQNKSQQQIYEINEEKIGRSKPYNHGQTQKKQYRQQYKRLAMQYLQQQKNELAEAFRIRYIKQKIFQIFKLLKYTQNKEEMQLKSKAWGVIKLFNVLDGLSKKTYQAENKNSKVK